MHAGFQGLCRSFVLEFSPDTYGVGTRENIVPETELERAAKDYAKKKRAALQRSVPQNQREGLEHDAKEAAGDLLKAAMKAYDPQLALSVADAEYGEDVSGEHLAVASE